MLGKILANRYKIVKHLGGGGFGQTFLAEDLQLPGNPLCVVKQLKPQSNDPDTLKTARRLFDTEAETLQRLGNHDQIPRLLAHFEQQQEFYLVQELIQGNELSQELPPGRIWIEAAVIDLLQEILKVLAFVHQENVIHRDLKPANLIRREKDSKIVLIDFGAVKQIRTQMANPQGHTSLSVGIGTLGYMPNEQANGKPRFSSDIYAVGMIGIQALTGIAPNLLPEDKRTGEIIWRNKAQVSPQFANILDKMVRHDFRQRYQDGDEALQAMSGLVKTDVGRRQFIKIAGLVGMGFVSSLLVREVFSRPSPSPTPLPSREEGTSSPSSSPTSGRRREKTSSPSSSPSSTDGGGEISQPSSSPTSTDRGNLNLQVFSFNVITVNSQGQRINSQRGQARFFTEDIDGVSLEMVAIPRGTFLMGSPETEKERDSDESPQHRVTVEAFFMGKFTVTQAQWQAVAALPQVNISLNSDPSKFKGANRPVEQVSWHDAQEFCARLSKKTGRNYRLPSEAEWEYACRAGTTTPFHFGEKITTDLVNYDGDSTYADAPKGIYRQQTTDVGSFPPNAFGLYDTHGNVWEWCADAWHENYNGAPSDGRVWQGGDDKYRLVRGGSWLNRPRNCRGALRSRFEPVSRFRNCGFRVVAVTSAWTL